MLLSVDLDGILLSLVLLVFLLFSGNEPRGKVTKFASGDDLEDDFSFVGEKTGAKTEDKSSDIVGSASLPQGSNVKSKKKQGPKIVNFVG